jgi:uncharacterized protein
MRVVIDTNVLVSALIAPSGIPARVVQYVERFQLYTSQEILQELARVVQYGRIRKRYKLDDATIAGYLEHLYAASTIVTVNIQVDAIQDDPDDNKFLACAVACQAGYLLSGDPHLLRVGGYQSTAILTPRQFLQILESSSG